MCQRELREQLVRVAVRSGKERPLLAAPPLRTVGASFPAHGSSHDEAPGGAGGSAAFSIRLVALPSMPLSDAGDADTAGVLFLAAPPWQERDQPSCRRMTPAEVGTAFAAGHVPSRYPRHYSGAFAFSAILYPPPPQFALRLPCPRGGAMTGLPSSDMSNTTGLVAVSPPVVLMAAPTHERGAGPTTYLLVHM